ncbi:MAG: diaminopimelate epimerase [Pseudorhizobium sp.]
MSISFQKMHANGDDFVIIDLRGQPNIIDRHVAKRLGDRNRGIGFNQLAIISDCDDAAAYLTFWNPDGSTLDACGSATRGVAWKLSQGTGSSSIVLRTNRGLLSCSKEVDGLISVDMGAPLLDWRDVPIGQEVDTLRLPLPGEPAACSMGNPHCTFFVDDLEAVQVEAVGVRTESHSLFPHKTTSISFR